MLWLLDDFLKNIYAKKLPFILTAGILGFLIYSNTFTDPFVFDDFGNIYANNAFRNLSLLTSWWSPLKPRFVGFFTFFLNYHIGAWNTSIYHLTNLAIHISASLILWRFLLLIFETPRIRNNAVAKYSREISVFCSLIFLAHPIQTEAVTYIVQRLESLAALFYILSLYFYLKGRVSKKIVYFIPALLSVFLAFMTKETAFSLPVMFLVLEIYLFGNYKRFLNPKIIAFALVFITLSLGSLFFLSSINDAFGSKTTLNGETVNTKNYLITQMEVSLKYTQLIIFPIGQSVDHLQPVVENINPLVIAGLVFLLILIFIAIYTFNKSPLLSFSIIWVFVTISITSSILPLKDLMMEHRLYLPMAGISLFIVTFLWHIRNRLPLKWTYLLAVLVLVYGVLTFSRNNIWLTRSGVWKDVVLQNPTNTRALTNLASAYLAERNYDNAQTYINKSLELFPANPDALVVRGSIEAQKGEFENAANDYKAALALSPNHLGAYYNMAVVFYKQKQFKDSADAFKKILNIEPDNVTIEEMLSYVLALGGDSREANIYKQKAITTDPSSAKDFARIEASEKNFEQKDISGGAPVN